MDVPKSWKVGKGRKGMSEGRKGLERNVRKSESEVIQVTWNFRKVGRSERVILESRKVGK